MYRICIYVYEEFFDTGIFSFGTLTVYFSNNRYSKHFLTVKIYYKELSIYWKL